MNGGGMEVIGAGRLYYIILCQKTEFSRDGSKSPGSVTDNRTARIHFGLSQHNIPIF